MDWLALKLIADRLFDQFLLLNDKIVSRKDYRPHWKITEIPRDTQSELVAEDLIALRTVSEQLRKYADMSYEIQLTSGEKFEK